VSLELKGKEENEKKEKETKIKHKGGRKAKNTIQDTHEI
jgi:hypothetical protein